MGQKWLTSAKKSSGNFGMIFTKVARMLLAVFDGQFSNEKLKDEKTLRKSLKNLSSTSHIDTQSIKYQWLLIFIKLSRFITQWAMALVQHSKNRAAVWHDLEHRVRA